MSSATVTAIAIGIAIGVCACSDIWVLRKSAPADAAPASVSETARREHAEKFFGGDPERNLRGGQEMRPRW